jgi:hypothetical protein
LGFYKKYEGKGLYVAFAEGETWYLYHHDAFLAKILAGTTMGSSSSWIDGGGYSFPVLSKKHIELLAPYRITGDTIAKPLPE